MSQPPTVNGTVSTPKFICVGSNHGKSTVSRPTIGASFVVGKAQIAEAMHSTATHCVATFIPFIAMVLYYTAKWVAIPNRVNRISTDVMLYVDTSLTPISALCQFLGTLYYGLLVTLAFVVLFKSCWKQG